MWYGVGMWCDSRYLVVLMLVVIMYFLISLCVLLCISMLVWVILLWLFSMKCILLFLNLMVLCLVCVLDSILYSWCSCCICGSRLFIQVLVLVLFLFIVFYIWVQVRCVCEFIIVLQKCECVIKLLWLICMLQMKYIWLIFGISEQMLLDRVFGSIGIMKLGKQIEVVCFCVFLFSGVLGCMQFEILVMVIIRWKLLVFGLQYIVLLKFLVFLLLMVISGVLCRLMWLLIIVGLIISGIEVVLFSIFCGNLNGSL